LRNLFAGLICVSVLLTACGGGGGTIATSSSGTGTGTGTGTAYNVTNAIVDQGPAALNAANIVATNIMYVNVTICAPGSTATCQTIDHVQVDTGSQGLRILSSVLNSTMLNALQPVTVNGAAVAECTQFVDGYSWGPLVTADMHIGGSDTATSGESAPGLPVQIIGATTYAVPTACSSGAANDTEEDTVVEFGANGIIGLGLFDEDCGTFCSQITANGTYFTCTNAGCVEAAVPVAMQSLNPVNNLAAQNGITDNNGVIIELPAVASSGVATLTGTLVFGISTQSNNALAPGVSVLTTDPNSGLVTASFMNQTFTTSYLDSGSNAYYFNDNSIPQCTQPSVPGFFCPGAGVFDPLSATLTGVNNQAAPVNFTIGDAYTLFSANETFAAFSDLGATAGTTGSGPQTFAVGLPYYYGHNVYTAMEHTNAGGTEGPYFAF
jgi:hypothetical protein